MKDVPAGPAPTTEVLCQPTESRRPTKSGIRNRAYDDCLMPIGLVSYNGSRLFRTHFMDGKITKITELLQAWSGGDKVWTCAPINAALSRQRAHVPRPQWPASCLLAFAGSLARSRAKKNLAHLDRRPGHHRTLAGPREYVVQIGHFQNRKTAYVLLGLCVRPVRDDHLAVG